MSPRPGQRSIAPRATVAIAGPSGGRDVIRRGASNAVGGLGALMTLGALVALVAFAAVGLGACTASPEPTICSSGRTAGTSENEDMAPGLACISCHELTNSGGDGMEAPSFAFAGTVYRRVHEPDFCVGGPEGSDPAEVEVISATGQHHLAPVTAGGNFMLELDAPLEFPITAGVRYRGRTRWMIQRQVTGDCNTCHTEQGERNAPGRIQLP
jgi:hypothetical protein